MNLTALHLRHHGASKYDASKFLPIRNSIYRRKPIGGLWTSPINSEYGWRQWCEDQNFSTGPLDEFFDIEFAGRVYVIDQLKDLLNAPLVRYTSPYGLVSVQSIDFEQLINQGYDAIHLTTKGQIETRFSEPINLYGWDCESVLIMNEKSIKPLVFA